MMTYNTLVFSLPVPRQVWKTRHEEGGQSAEQGTREGRKEAHVERLPKSTTSIMVEKRTATDSRVDVRHAGERVTLRCGLLEHERFKHSSEAQKRSKRDIHHL